MRTARENQIADEVEKTLQSFDNDVILEGNPFLVSRIKAERDSRSHKPTRGFVLSFGLHQALLLFILLMNLITVVYWHERNAKDTLQEQLVSELTVDFQMDQSQSTF